MKNFDHIIIGFGKGGKTLAGALAAKGEKVALVERSPLMFGGTCINVACIPTKTLEYSARLSAAQGGNFSEKAARYKTAVEEKRLLTAALRQKNFEKAVAAGVEVIVGEARFLDGHRIEVALAEGGREELTGGQIYINTGARPFIPPIEGLADSRFVYTSETLMELDDLPARLVIIGGGYIGLEFASYYANFGSAVTVVQDGEAFIPKEDRELADAVLESLRGRGIRIIRGAAVRSVKDGETSVAITVGIDRKEEILEADAVLVATGRRPNTAGLNLEAAGVELTERGAVKVDETLRTTAPGIWAMGDVAGGLQFTDSRIVRSQLLGDGSRTTANRGAVPYSVFIDPPLSRVGLTEEEARAKGYEVKVARLAAGAVPKARVLRRPDGLLKAVVDGQTGRILGAHFFCAESHELINLVKIAMDAGLPYTVLRDAVYTHPTMSEALNDLFASL